MRAIEVTIHVSPDGAVELEGPLDLAPGKHHALLVLEETATARPGRQPLTLRTYPVGLASKDETFRREDLYGDGGR